MTKELIKAGALRQFRHNDGSEGFVFAYDKAIVDRLMASTVSKEWLELTRRLYVELFYCHKQMIEATDENDEPIWVSGFTVPRVLQDAKEALELASRFRAEGGNTKPDSSPAPATGGEPVPASTGREHAMLRAINTLRKALAEAGIKKNEADRIALRALDATSEFADAARDVALSVAARELDVEAERRDFEAWANADGYDLTRETDGDGYFYNSASHAWGAWLAARVGSFLRSGSAAQGSAPTPAKAEIDFLEEWLHFAEEPIGLECCGRGYSECCGEAVPVQRNYAEFIDAMEARHKKLVAELPAAGSARQGGEQTPSKEQDNG